MSVTLTMEDARLIAPMQWAPTSVHVSQAISLQLINIPVWVSYYFYYFKIFYQIIFKVGNVHFYKIARRYYSAYIL